MHSSGCRIWEQARGERGKRLLKVSLIWMRKFETACNCASEQREDDTEHTNLNKMHLGVGAFRFGPGACCGWLDGGAGR